MSPPLIMITGGEPLLQQPALTVLARALAGQGRRVEIATNGTRNPRPELSQATAQFIVSPTLSTFGAGMREVRRINPSALLAFADSGKAVFKFVITTPADLDSLFPRPNRQ